MSSRAKQRMTFGGMCAAVLLTGCTSYTIQYQEPKGGGLVWVERPWASCGAYHERCVDALVSVRDGYEPELLRAIAQLNSIFEEVTDAGIQIPDRDYKTEEDVCYNVGLLSIAAGDFVVAEQALMSAGTRYTDTFLRAAEFREALGQTEATIKTPCDRRAANEAIQ